VNSGVPPSQIARLDIVMGFAEKCEEMEGSFELRVFNPNDDPLDSNRPVAASDTFSGRQVSID
jgi:CRISPR/Cas system type I-B associated protein Csh2 (Cas7 group RAMP superfamily)